MTARRRMARQGKLALSVEDEASFAVLVLDEPLAGPNPEAAGRLEIAVDGVVVRLAEDASAARVAEVAAALRSAR